MPTAKAFDVANEKAVKLRQKLAEHHQTRANNNAIVYSNKISDQILRSFAAKSFNCLKINLVHFEIINLSRFWDDVDFESYSIPTIIEIVEREDVLQLACQEYIKHDSELDKRFAIEQARIGEKNIRCGIAMCKKIKESDLLKQARNFRH